MEIVFKLIKIFLMAASVMCFIGPLTLASLNLVEKVSMWWQKRVKVSDEANEILTYSTLLFAGVILALLAN